MNTTVVDATNISPLGHTEAMHLQATELDRTLAVLGSLDDDEWTRSTDCPDWDVHHLYLHVLGACEAACSLRENLHQLRAGKRHQKAHGGPLEAGLSAIQVSERADLDAGSMVERLAAVAPSTVRKRTKLPSLMRRMTMKVDGPVVEKWTVGYMVDTVYLRDLWMHRVDATRATGREMELTPDHDGRIVADVVAEWARRHGQPFTLQLTGPAGGRYTSAGSASGDADLVEGDGEESRELDAVEFCRILAGRGSGEGLLATIVPF